MQKLVYRARPHHVLVEDGSEIRGGEDFTVTAERAQQLLADRHVTVEEAQSDLRKLTRAQLDQLAADHGIEDPQAFGSKADLIDALEAAA